MSDRRSFLARLLAGTAAAVALPVLYGISRYLKPPRTLPATVTVDEKLLPKEREAPRIVRVGTKDVALTRDDDGRIHALDMTCTHTGCSVVWRDATNQFHCPCHNGVFNQRGEVLSGPPRRELERLRVETHRKSVSVTDEAA